VFEGLFILLFSKNLEGKYTFWMFQTSLICANTSTTIIEKGMKQRHIILKASSRKMTNLNIVHSKS
jgi:hypothetical protein